MPSSVIKAFSRQSGKSPAVVEKHWKDLKKQYGEDYAAIVGTLKKILKIESNHMKGFKNYLKEQEEKIVIIATSATEAKNIDNLDRIGKDENKYLKILKKMGITAHVIFLDNVYYELQKDGNIFIKNNRFEEPQKLILDPKKVKVLVRQELTAGREAFYDFLIENGIPVVNQKETIKICGSKYKTFQKLKENGIPTPESVMVSDEDSIIPAMKKIGNKFPVIVKTVRGSLGKGVVKVESPEQLPSILQSIWLSDANDVLIQPYHKIDFDVRTFVINGKIVASIRRNKIKGDFRSNITLGAEAEKYELNDEEKEIVLRSHHAVKANYSGVDHFVVKGKPIVIEVNSCPGTTGIDKASGVDVSTELLKYVLTL